ncbi:MAG: redoxin domain-containing protein [Planctomycetes bacterium]|nr:redoxin domain-containing protein [Planctomycetota bacterium]
MKKRLLVLLAMIACVGVGLFSTTTGLDAASLKTLPSLSLKTLSEQEVRLTDDRFKDKIIVVAAFTTWNDVSRRQARALEVFHKENPNVEIVALVVDEIAAARDFVAQEGLTYPCYKSSDGPRVGTNLMRLFEAKKNKQVIVNRVPFVIIADKERRVVYAQFGVTSETTIKEKIAAIK